jgi:hypothetical protein
MLVSGPLNNTINLLTRVWSTFIVPCECGGGVEFWGSFRSNLRTYVQGQQCRSGQIAPLARRGVRHGEASYPGSWSPVHDRPCALSEGLPIGMMLVGKKCDETTILKAARAFEGTEAYAVSPEGAKSASS